MNHNRVKFTSNNFRIIEVSYALTTTGDKKHNPLSYSTYSILEEKHVNSLGEVYYAPIPDMHYGNFDLMMKITDAYNRFIKDIK